MTRYTVTYSSVALNALAQLWMSATDRRAISVAGDSIEDILREDAPSKGQQLPAGLRQLIVGPIVVEFSIVEADRIVTIWAVRHTGTLTNGH